MSMLSVAVAEFWSHWVGPLLQFVIGLGLVVFIHELGHFLVAKMVGIKVERFAIGFGPRLIGIKKGETDYCINAFPLGGYVKMLGQEDFAPQSKPDKPDPRSYEGKSVGQRFAVIAAGVVMNVLLAGVLFIIVGMVGMDFPAPIVGSTENGFPASQVELKWRPTEQTQGTASAPATQPVFAPGLQPGDVITEIDGDPITRFIDITMKSTLADNEDQKFDIAVRRQGPAGSTWIGTGQMGVKGDGKLLIFGMRPAEDNVFGLLDGYLADSPFLDGDKLLAINGKPVKNVWSVPEIEKRLDGQAVTVTVERPRKDEEQADRISLNIQPDVTTKPDVVYLADGSRGKAVETVAQDEKILYRVKLSDGREELLRQDQFAGGGMVERLDILGLIPRLKAEMVEQGSRADKAGILPGDVIVGYGDHAAPVLRRFYKISDGAVGKLTDIVVLRDGERITLKVTPKLKETAQPKRKRALVGMVNSVDLANPVVAGVRAGSAAQKVGLVAGDIIEQVNGKAVGNWVDLLLALKTLRGKEVNIGFRRNLEEMTATIATLSDEAFDPADYDVKLFQSTAFKPMVVTVHKPNPISAMAWGATETWNFMARTYATLRALAKRTVSTDSLVGPVGIAMIAVKVGRQQSIIPFVYFVAFISATIAVINFLPFPVVDGGHAVFLLIEKIRGKPLPAKVMDIAQYIGLALILLVFILLTWQDIARWITQLW